MIVCRSSIVGAAASALVAGVALATPPRLPVVERPILIEATVCEPPGKACADPDETLRLIVQGAERRIGFTRLVVLDGSVTGGTVYAELRVRPVRLFGAPEELAKLVPGTPLRLRAVVRLGARYLFAESLAPPTEK